jgi:hypothetical protein
MILIDSFPTSFLAYSQKILTAFLGVVNGSTNPVKVASSMLVNLAANS